MPNEIWKRYDLEFIEEQKYNAAFGVYSYMNLIVIVHVFSSHIYVTFDNMMISLLESSNLNKTDFTREY